VDLDTYDNTFNSPVTIGADGSYYDGFEYTYLAGANGAALMLIGSSQQFSMIVGVHAPSYTPTSTVWLNPVGITNAANYTPITNAFAPGELVNLYGNFGASSQVDQVLPIPTTLSGVQVLVNGQVAPVYAAGKNQISILIPYELAGQIFATFQVVVNGSKSNSVTVYVDNSAPGVYSISQNGIGPGAILHSNFSAVTDQSPAKPGETVQLFMTGLGPVTPQLADGVAAPDSPLSNSVQAADIVIVLEDGVDSPAVLYPSFAGLAPGFAGLYQVNFTLPDTGLSDGDVTIAFNTVEALNTMSTINVSGYSQDFARVAPRQRSPRLKRAASGRHSKKFRRALPERP
jgi:uncharacterized protein (TIGR03437 family)